MLVELTDSAASDVLEAALAYEAERPGLGLRFEGEVDAAFGRVGERPKQYPEVAPDVRRALLRVFPYGAYFTIVGDRVRVFAVLHQHRNPKTWRARSR